MKNQWWGYLHEQGIVQAKRYFDYGDIVEARESPFVKRIHAAPFDADTREEALNELNRYFGIGISQ